MTINGGRGFLSFVFLFTACLVLGGCHGSRGLDPFNVPESFDEAESYEITFWAKNDTNKSQTEVYGKAIEDFQRIYPNIHVNMRLYTNYGDIYNDVITNISTNTTPNVCITYPDHIATYLTGANVVVPLDELFENEAYGLGGSRVRFDSVKRDEISEKFLEECSINGVHYAIPFMRSTECCYVNKTYVEQLGFTLPEVLTWDFVWQVSEAAMEQDESGIFSINGQSVLIPFLYKSTDNMMIQRLKQASEPYSDPNGEILLFHEGTKDFLKTIAQHSASRAFSTFKISGYPANYLNAGQCIFAVDSTAGSTWMGTDAPLSDISPDKLVRFETEVCMVPQLDPENPRMISQGPSICVFNKRDSGEVLASWLFAQYLLTNEVQIGYAETEGYIPVTKRAHSDETYQAYLKDKSGDNKHYEVKLKASKLLLEHIDDTFVTPVFNGSASLRDAAGQLIENTVKSVRRKETVDEAYLDKLFADVTALYRLGEGKQQASGRKDLGPLPGTAIALLAALGAVWVGIIFYFIREQMKKRREND